MKPSIQAYNTPEKAADYHAGLQPGSIRDRMLQVTAQTLRDALPDGGRVLELGAGTGHLTRKILELNHFAEVLPTDGSEEMLSVARNSMPSVPFQLLDYFDPDWSQSFSGIRGVVSSLTFHYHPEKSRLFREIHALLPRGGVLVFADKIAPDHPLQASLFDYENARRWLKRHPLPEEVAEVAQKTEAWNRQSGKHLETASRLLNHLERAGFMAGQLWQEHNHAIFAAVRK
ncbi:class I SAM-dependent methyltransferase [Deinococcus cellulosilyticus]|nr:class I SAM-dependent methyltransferase [Deinococcus cellulosilyticus]